MKKILLVTFSDNADHQDTTFGMYEEMQKCNDYDTYLLTIKNPKVPLTTSKKTWLVDCPKRPGITKGTFNIKLLLSIVRKIKKEKFDYIYFESLHLWNLPIMMLIGKNSIKYQVIHEVIPHEGDKQVKMVDLMNKAVCRFADYIVLRNKKYVPLMSQNYDIDENHVKYLELWRRYPKFTEPTYSKKVLFFGRINPYKGIDNLLEIAKKCPNIQFEVMGRVDPQMESIVENIRELQNVSVNDGYVTDEEMKNAFISTDWVIVPYNSASQSGIIIDAYKYSRPVIAFEVGAIKEQVRDQISGFLIPEKNIDEFSNKLEQVNTMDHKDYLNFCHQAYDYGSQKYAVSYATKRFIDLFGDEGGKR
ncbi:MAG: glycosyltransferase [Intestinibaculum porci]|uniref:glycosyltransferase n=1 Tax=Intestinibaculum porci TaxID=2487118 RepID=UPI003F0F1A18